MNFYHLSLGSALLLALIYHAGTLGLHWVWQRLRWRVRNSWCYMLPGFVLLYTLPVAEECWIAWNFRRLCGPASPWLMPEARTAESPAAGALDGEEVAYKIERRAVQLASGKGSAGPSQFIRHPPWFHLDGEAPLVACAGHSM